MAACASVVWGVGVRGGGSVWLVDGEKGWKTWKGLKGRSRFRGCG